MVALSPRDRLIAGVAAVMLAVGLPVAYTSGSDDDLRGAVIVLVVALAILAGVFLRLVPNMRSDPARTSRAALILGIVAFVTIVLFWTGLPIVLGAGAVALALALTPRSTEATAGLVLGAVAMVAAFAILLSGA